MSLSVPELYTPDASRIGRDRALALMFAGKGLAWLTDESYDPVGPIWRILLVCQGPQGHWYRRHYRYDIPSETVHFAGEEPISPAELAAARRSGRRIA